MADGTLKEFPVEDHAWRKCGRGRRHDLPPFFVTALEIRRRADGGGGGALRGHQHFKTVNVPEDYPYEESGPLRYA